MNTKAPKAKRRPRSRHSADGSSQAWPGAPALPRAQAAEGAQALPKQGWLVLRDNETANPDRGLTRHDREFCWALA